MHSVGYKPVSTQLHRGKCSFEGFSSNKTDRRAPACTGSEASASGAFHHGNHEATVAEYCGPNPARLYIRHSAHMTPAAAPRTSEIASNDAPLRLLPHFIRGILK